MNEEEKITNAQQYIQGIRNSRDALASILIASGFPVTEDDKLQDLIDMFDTIPLNRIGDPDNLTTVHKETLVAAINELDANIKSLSLLDIEVVEELPTEDISDTTIYLVPKSGSQQRNIYEEWLHVNARWEKIGDTDVDLSNYATLTDLSNLQTTLETAIGTKANQSDLNTTNTNVTNLENRVSTTEQDIASINTQLTNLAGIINATDPLHPVNLNSYNTSGTWLLVGEYFTPNISDIDIDNYHYTSSLGGILRIVENDNTSVDTVWQYLEIIGSAEDANVDNDFSKLVYYREIENSSWITKIIPYINDGTTNNSSSNKNTTYSRNKIDALLADINTVLSNKQDTLVSGTNIKTINGNSILGSGDLDLSLECEFITFDTTVNNMSSDKKAELVSLINKTDAELKNVILVNTHTPETSVYGTTIFRFKGREHAGEASEVIKFYSDMVTTNSSGEGKKQIKNVNVYVQIYKSNSIVVSYTGGSILAQVIDTDTDYATPYTPLYDGSPATKKYVDDNIPNLISCTNSDIDNLFIEGGNE